MFVTHRFRLLVSAFALVWLGTACPAEEDPPEGGTGSGSASDDTSTGSDPGATSMDPGPSTGEPGPATDTGESTGADSTGGGDDGCLCVTETDGFVELACDVEELCEPVEVGCAQEPLSSCELADLTVIDPQVLECHHDALVAGSPGLLRWELPYVADPGAEGQRFLLLLTGEGNVVTWHESWGVPTYAFSDVALGPLRAAEHFDGCMELPTPEETFRCLFDPSESVSNVCIPAHEIPIG
jgi:hypothetical protein